MPVSCDGLLCVCLTHSTRVAGWLTVRSSELWQYIMTVSCVLGSDWGLQVAMMMFEKLIEHVGDTLRQHFTQFSVLFGTGLNDPESLAVQVAALKVPSPADALSESEQTRNG